MDSEGYFLVYRYKQGLSEKICELNLALTSTIINSTYPLPGLVSVTSFITVQSAICFEDQSTRITQKVRTKSINYGTNIESHI